MPTQPTAALLAARRAARRAPKGASSPASDGPMFSSIGQDAPRRGGPSRLVLAVATLGVGAASLALAAQLFGWGRPPLPVRVEMMAEEADAAARALQAPPTAQETP